MASLPSRTIVLSAAQSASSVTVDSTRAGVRVASTPEIIDGELRLRLGEAGSKQAPLGGSQAHPGAAVPHGRHDHDEEEEHQGVRSGARTRLQGEGRVRTFNLDEAVEDREASGQPLQNPDASLTSRQARDGATAL